MADILKVGLDASSYPTDAQIVIKANDKMFDSTNRANSALLALEGRFSRVSKQAAGLSAAAKALAEIQTPARNMMGFLANLEQRFARIGATIAVFVGIGAAIQGVTSFIRSGIKSIEEYQVTLISVTASLTQIALLVQKQNGETPNLGKAYAESAKYAGVLAEKMREVDLASVANYDQIMLLLQVYTNTGRVLDANNGKQMAGFTALSNAIPMMTKGQDITKQMASEMRALMSGSLRPGDVIATAVNDMAKASGKYKEGLKDIIKTSKQTGDSILELVSEYLEGYVASLPAIAQTLTTAKSSFETAFGMMQRKAFGNMVSDITLMITQSSNIIKSNTGEVTNIVNAAWTKVRDTLFNYRTEATAYGDMKVFTIKPEVLASLKAVYEILASAGRFLTSATLLAIKHADAVMVMVKVYTAWKILGLANWVIQNAQNAVLAVRTSLLNQMNASTVSASAAEQAHALILAEKVKVLGAEMTAQAEATAAQARKNAAIQEEAAALIRNAPLQMAELERSKTLVMQIQEENAALISGTIARGRAAQERVNNAKEWIEGERSRLSSNPTALAALNNGTKMKQAKEELTRATKLLALAEADYLSIEKNAIALGAEEDAIVRRLTAARAELNAAMMTSMMPGATAAALKYNSVLAAQGITTGAVAASELALKQIRFAAMSDAEKRLAISRAHSLALGMEAVSQNNARAALFASMSTRSTATINMIAYRAATIAATAATTLATAATTALKGAMTLLGGPIGAVIAAVMLAVYWWNKYGEAAKEARDKALGESKSQLEGVNALVKEIKTRERLAELAKKQAELADKPKTAAPLTNEDEMTSKMGNEKARYLGILQSIEDATKKGMAAQVALNKLESEGMKEWATKEVKKRELLKEQAAANKILAESVEARTQLEELARKGKLKEDEAPKGLKGQPAEMVDNERFNKDKSLWEAFLSYVDGAAKNLITIEKETSARRVAAENESYRLGETSLMQHIENMKNLQQQQLANDNDYIKMQISAHEKALAYMDTKRPELNSKVRNLAADPNTEIWQVEALVGTRPSMPAKDATGADKEALRSWENNREAVIAYFKTLKELEGYKTQITVNQRKSTEINSDADRQRAIGIEEYKDSLVNLQVEQLKYNSMNEAAAKLELTSVKNNRELTKAKAALSTAQREEYTAIDAGKDPSAAREEVKRQREILRILEEKNDEFVAAGRLLDRQVISTRKLAAATSEQAKSAYEASQVGVDYKSGAVTDTYANEIAQIEDKAKSELENLNIKMDLEKQIRDDASLADSMRFEAAMKILDIENQIAQVKGTKAKSEAAAQLKEYQTGLQGVASFAQKTWPKITSFEKASSMLTKSYAKEKQTEEEKATDTYRLSTKGKLQMTSDFTSLASNMFTDLASTQDQTSRSGFETAKAYNTAAAIMSTASAIVNALATSGPPWVGIAMAAAVAAMGAVQIAAIQSTSFGGGGTVTAPSGSFAAGGAAGQVSSDDTDTAVSGGTKAKAALGTSTDNVSGRRWDEIADTLGNAALAMSMAAEALYSVSESFADGSGSRLGINAPNKWASVGEATNGVGYWNNMTKYGGAGFTAGAFLGGSFGAGIGGAFAGPIGGAIGGAIGAVVNGLTFGLTGAVAGLGVSLYKSAFGMGSKKQTGAGIQMGLSEGEIGLQSYTTWKKKGGWFRSDKTGTDYKSMAGSSYENDLNTEFDKMKEGLKLGAVMLGQSGAKMEDVANTTTVGIDKIATAGRSTEDIAADIQAGFTKMSNAIIEGAIPNIADYYIDSAETATDVFFRLATSIRDVNNSFTIIGKATMEATMDNAAAAYELINAYGDVETYSEAVSTYVSSMFNEADQKRLTINADKMIAGSTWETNKDLMEELGIYTIPKTNAEFVNMINSIDITTKSGSELFKAMLDLAPTFAEQIKLTEELATAIAEYIDDIKVRTLSALGDNSGADYYSLVAEQKAEYKNAVESGLLSSAELADFSYMLGLELAKFVQDAIDEAASIIRSFDLDLAQLIADNSGSKYTTGMTSLVNDYITKLDEAVSNGVDVTRIEALGVALQDGIKRYVLDTITEVNDAVNNAQKSLTSAQTSLTNAENAYADAMGTSLKGVAKALKTAADELQDVADKMKESLTKELDTQESLLDAIKSIRGGAQLSPEDAYNQARSAFENSTDSNLASTAQAFMEASLAYNASGAGYFSDQSTVLAKLGGKTGLGTDPSYDVAQQQLDKLEKIREILDGGDEEQITALREITGSNTTLGGAVLNLSSDTLDSILALNRSTGAQNSLVSYLDAQTQATTKLNEYTAANTKAEEASTEATKASTLATLESAKTALVTAQTNYDNAVQDRSNFATSLGVTVDGLEAFGTSLEATMSPVSTAIETYTSTMTTLTGYIIQALERTTIAENGPSALSAFNTSVGELEDIRSDLTELKTSYTSGNIGVDEYTSASQQMLMHQWAPKASDVTDKYNTATSVGLTGIALPDFTTNATITKADNDVRMANEKYSTAAMNMASKLVPTDLRYDLAPMVNGVVKKDGAVDGRDALVWLMINRGDIKWSSLGLPAFAKGGISNGPSIFGEDGPEAAVPLPDGRSIPVKISGSADNKGVEERLDKVVQGLLAVEKKLGTIENRARLAANQ